MKFKVFIFCCLLFCACKEEEVHTTLVTENLSFFSLFDATCENWVELRYPCATQNCFSSSAVEIVGIDTADAENYKIYAWVWNEHFVQKEGQLYAGSQKLLIASFLMDATKRKLEIKDVFTPNENLGIEDQLVENGFPEVLIEKYFVKQTAQVEKVRIQALAQKAKDKFRLYLDESYKIDSTLVIPQDSTVEVKDSVGL